MTMTAVHSRQRRLSLTNGGGKLSVLIVCAIGCFSLSLPIEMMFAQDENPSQYTPPASFIPTLESLIKAQDELLPLILTEEGLVRYDLLQKNPLRNHLDSLVAGYAQIPFPTEDPDRLTYLINAYNVNVMQQILIAGTPENVMDVPGFFDQRQITIGHRSMTLNDLENVHIRPIGDPRIHAALNCAAVSCPSLATQAFRPQTLDEQLDRQCRAWINDEIRNRVLEDGSLEISQLFEWFGDDFVVDSFTDVKGFIHHYAKTGSALGKATAGEGSSPSISYMPYDWTLNSAPVNVETEDDR